MLGPTFEFVVKIIVQYIWPLFLVALGLGVAILLHEFGHFIVARLAGVRADVFSVGFGRTLWSRNWGGTEFRLSAIPLGGYVRLRGILSEEAERYLMGDEEEEGGEKKEGEAEKAAAAAGQPAGAETELVGGAGETAPEKKEEKKSAAQIMVQDAEGDVKALRNKIWPVRVAVFAAGCAFNFLVAMTIFFFMFWIGFDEDAPLPSFVGEVKPGTPVYEAGLREGDRIVSIAGQRVARWEQAVSEEQRGVLNVLVERKDSAPDRPTTAVVSRTVDGEETTRALTLPAAGSLIATLNQSWSPRTPAVVGGVIPFSAAHKAGLERNDEVVAIGGQSITSFQDLNDIVRASIGKELVFEVRRNDRVTSVAVTPQENPTTPTIGMIGILSGNVEKIHIQKGFVAAWTTAFTYTVDFTVLVAVKTAQVFARLNPREIKQNIAGPIGILGISFQSARSGWQDFLRFMAFLNVALLIFNLLPIPVLDGGHIMITTVESVIRRPVPPKVLAGVFYTFFIFLISVAVLVTVFDVLRFADFFDVGKLFR